MILSSQGVLAQLVYDPLTNTYTDASGQTVTQVQVNTNTDTIIVDGEVRVYDPWTGEYVPQDQLSQDTSDGLIDETSLDQEVVAVYEQVEDQVDDDSPAIIQPTQDPVVSRVVRTTQQLRDELQDQQSDLQEYLRTMERDVQETYDDSLQRVYWVYYDEVASCIGDPAILEQLEQEIDDLSTTLRTRITSRAAELIADIAYIEYLMDVGQMSQPQQNVEAGILANSIETYSQNSLLLIEHYVTQAQQNIREFVQDTQSDVSDENIQIYVEKKEMIDRLIRQIQLFESGTSFNQTVVGPRADQLRALSEQVRDLFVDQIDQNTAWLGLSQKEFLTRNIRLDYLQYVDEILEDLFPSQWIQDVYRSYSVIEDAYNIWQDATVTCRDLYGSDLIMDTGTELIQKIQSVQEQIAVSNAILWQPSDRASLKASFNSYLVQYYNQSIVAQIAIARGEEPVAFQQTQETQQVVNYDRYVAATLQFLQDMRQTYIDKNDIRGFEVRLERAYTKLESKLVTTIPSTRTHTILLAIQDAIEQILGQ